MIVGLDGNRWERRLGVDETYRPRRDDQWYPEEAFFSDSASHGLVDAFLAFARRDPVIREALPNRHVPGPLALTYQRRSKGQPVPERMDYVFASPDLVADRVLHPYEDGRAFGSDHAPVCASLSVHAERRRV